MAFTCNQRYKKLTTYESILKAVRQAYERFSSEGGSIVGVYVTIEKFITDISELKFFFLDGKYQTCGCDDRTKKIKWYKTEDQKKSVMEFVELVRAVYDNSPGNIAQGFQRWVLI